MAQRGFSISITNHLSSRQAVTFAQWIGCANVLRNGKVREYLALLSKGRGAEIAQGYADIKKDPDLPFLKETPVQILRNAASAVFRDAEAARRKLRKFPKVKGRSKKRSCIITKELFDLHLVGKNETQITIYDSATKRRSKLFSITLPYSQNSLSKQFIISRQGRSFFFSGSHEDGKLNRGNEAILEDYAHLNEQALLTHINGIDGGVARPLQASNGELFDYTDDEKTKLKKHNNRIKRLQNALASKKRRNGNKSKRCESDNQRRLANQVATLYGKTRRIRLAFAHRASRRVVEMQGDIVVVEDLNLKAMTKRAKKKTKGRESLKNGARAKTGLNRSMNNVGLGQIYTLIKYKSNEKGKGFVKVDPSYTSKECHACGSRDTHRKTQAEFHCRNCGLDANADENAARNIAKRGARDIKSGAFIDKIKPRKTIARRRTKMEAPPPLVEELPSGKKSESREGDCSVSAASRHSVAERPGIRPKTLGHPHLSQHETEPLSTTKVNA